MKMKLLILAVLPFLTSINMNSQEEKNSWVQYVNPLIGTEVWQSGVAVAGHEDPSGYTFPGVTEPFGMTEWTAHTLESKHAGTLHHRVPYWYKHNYISGFMGTHYPSGAVMFDYGAVELMPVVGQLKCRPEERSSSFTHITEKSKPHFYEVMLDDYQVKAQLSATKTSAILQFTYPQSDSAYVVVDAMPSMFTAGAPGYIHIDPVRKEISGKSIQSARGYRETGYFVVRFDKDFESFGTFNLNNDYPEVIEEKYLFTQKEGKWVNGLKGIYTQDSKGFGHLRSERIDPVIDFDWDWYKPADDFSFNDYQVTWSGKLKAPSTGEYTLGIQADDGARLYINGELLIDDWKSHSFSYQPTQKKISLEAGKMYDIKLEYYQHEWSSRIKLSWIRPDKKSSTSLLTGNRHLESSTKIGGYIRFKTGKNEVIKAIVGTSFISVEQARINLEREIGAKSMETISAQTEALWNQELSVIDLPGAAEQDKIVFYTALYHSFLLPRSLSEDGKYRSPFDGKVHKGISFTDYSIWDTFRATHPLFVLLKPDFAGDLITGLLHAYDEGGWLPKWPNPGYANCMMGTHSDAIIADAYVKGVRNFDVEKAKKAVLKNAYDKGNHVAWGRLGIMDYERLGYVPVDKYGESVARTMEFAYDDYCLSRFFAEKGEPDLSDKLGKRSKNFRNVLDKETKMVRARKADGSWSHPEDYDISVWSGFNPKGVYNYKKNYTLFVPHDVPELIRFLGGTDSLAVFMDELFDKDIYYVGDEFVMHAPYMYNLCKKPWMTQKRIYDIVNKYYLPTPSGLPGNDDCGQLSSWYIFSAMGFYPMCPASIEYQLGVPCLPGFVLHLPQNRTFTIKTKNFGKGNCYVRAVYLNGKPHRSSVITHSDIINGGEILFELTDKPAYNWFQ